MQPDMVHALVQLFNTGQWEELESRTRSLMVRYPSNPLAWRARGKALLKTGQIKEAIAALERLVKLVPGEAEAHNDLGLAYQADGQLAVAERLFRQAILVRADCVEALGNLAVLVAQAGRHDEACALQSQCVALAPQSAVAHNNLGCTLRESGQLQTALSCFDQALRLAPQYVEARVNLAATLFDLHRFDEAQHAYQQALALQPDSVLILTQFGRTLAKLDRDMDVAVAMLEKAVALSPNDPDALVALGNALLPASTASGVDALFRRALALRPLISWPARRKPADFSVLVLDSPGAGSTPIDYLIRQANYDTFFYCVLPGFDHDIDMLRSKADLVINIVSDADSGADALPESISLARRLGCSTLNHPAQIIETDRATTASRLADLPHCKMPATIRQNGQALAQAALRQQIPGFALPVLLRLAGNHGGDALEKMGTWEQVYAFAQAHLASHLYVTEYADYRSADGFYRKYRFICIDGELLPYHLAIHDDWMVHHFRTDMAHQGWKREEELAFLMQPEQVFAANGMSTLKAIAASTKLDYCGIDCALDSHGDIIVFEVNATMLVHDETSDTFSYKNAYVKCIKDAFTAMIVRRALHLGPPRPDEA